MSDLEFKLNLLPGFYVREEKAFFLAWNMMNKMVIYNTNINGI